MKKCSLLLAAAATVVGTAQEERVVTDENKTTLPTTLLAGQPGEYRAFEAVEIANDIKIGYGICAADVNGDGRLDIVVADAEQFWWFENPAWKRHALTAKGATKPDNVAIAAGDLDGDGQVDFAAGADWQIQNTHSGGDVLWLRRGADAYQPWKVTVVGHAPTLHRVALADLDGDGRQELIAVPLLGKGSTKEKNWRDAPVRIVAYKPPADPLREPWTEVVLDESLHVTHNFALVSGGFSALKDLLVASYDGVFRLRASSASALEKEKIGEGHQMGSVNALTRPHPSLGASEISFGTLPGGKHFVATIEPWHGHQVVAYALGDAPAPLPRRVLDDTGMWGHALACARISSLEHDDILVGWRDPSQDRGKPGIVAYVPLAADGSKWRKHVLDETVAVESLCVADFNGDGKADLAAAGRATRNVRLLLQK